MAKVFAAIAPIFCAMASCLPIGRPHCTRSFDQVREISRQRFPAPTAEMGSVRRPVLRVTSASFNPAHLPEHVFLRYADVGESDHAVVDRLEPHEVAAVRPGD